MKESRRCKKHHQPKANLQPVEQNEFLELLQYLTPSQNFFCTLGYMVVTSHEIEIAKPINFAI